jgi:mevalonate kinase
MNGERNTPVGTPVVVAPGKIVLVGEYAIVEDCPAVVAAIARYAKAQFVPRRVEVSKLVAEVVRRAQVELGGLVTALPVGSVQVDDEAFRCDGPLVGLGSTAATSVAIVGALLEALGLPVGNRRSMVVAIATSGRRALGGRAGSGADLLAATYGGLVQISRTRGAAPRAFPIEPPSALHLVLFSAPPSITPQRMAEGVQSYAQLDPIGFEGRTGALRGLAKRFIDEVNAGRSTGAIAAAGKYGDELAALGVAAEVPITNSAFDSVARLARALGGIAKPTGAGNGSLGVAMFATREAAHLFRKASPPFVSILEGELDRLGVRCQAPAGQSDEEPPYMTELPTPLPEVLAEEDVAAEKAGTVTCEVDEADTAPTVVPSSPPPPPADTGRHLRRRVASAVTVAGAIALAGVLAVPKRIPARLHASTPTSRAADPMSSASSMPVLPPIAMPPLARPAPAPSPPSETSPGFDEAAEAPTRQSTPAPSKPRKALTARPTTAAPRKTAQALHPAGPPSPGALRPSRAGRLSPADF